MCMSVLEDTLDLQHAICLYTGSGEDIEDGDSEDYGKKVAIFCHTSHIPHFFQGHSSI